MTLSPLDWSIILASFAISLVIGLLASRKALSGSQDYFLSGRSMPWWLLGVSMVATTFAADTPNLVAELVRTQGVSGNWVWWAFLLTGMLTTFVYARLWRRSGIVTDLEFYELRYTGSIASFLRGFRAIYLGVIFNVIVMATVCLAGVKLGAALLGLSPLQTLGYTAVITVAYSALGGLRGVILTDFFQFALAMTGAIGAAWYISTLPEIGGLAALFTHPAVTPKLSLVPDLHDPEAYVPLLVLPLAVQWWASWYPGAEPGGGGYVAQRMLAAKSENHALGATFLFNVAHYALRPWPWIIVALASLVIYPELADLKAAFPELSEAQVKDDLGYPIMLRLLPSGLLGIVVASLIAALMSTLSTHLNWGASYLVNDFYLRFLDPQASERQQVVAGQLATVVLMILAVIFALVLESALSGFQILLQVGAGTGLIFILRWLWWRINAYSELSAMLVSFAIALYFAFVHTRLGFAPVSASSQMLIGVGVTTVCWLAVTFLTRPTDRKVLEAFVQRVNPPRLGWAGIGTTSQSPATSILGYQLLSALFGALMVYALLFGVSYTLYQQTGIALIWFAAALGFGASLIWFLRKQRSTPIQ